MAACSEDLLITFLILCSLQVAALLAHGADVRRPDHEVLTLTLTLTLILTLTLTLTR